MQPPETGTTSDNLFIDALPGKSQAALAPHLAKVALGLDETIAQAGMAIDRIIFPLRSVVSSVTRMRDGTDVEVTVIGREGLYGLQTILGDGLSSNEAMVQMAGSAYTMNAETFAQAVRDDAVLRRSVLRYAQAIVETISQFSGCNRLHSIEERCARWLLMVRDRVVADEFVVTHEFLATMLGVRRPSVTLTLGTFERAGLLQLSRGRITILNVPGLAIVACECYEDTNITFERLMGYSVRR